MQLSKLLGEMAWQLWLGALPKDLHEKHPMPMVRKCAIIIGYAGS